MTQTRGPARIPTGREDGEDLSLGLDGTLRKTTELVSDERATEVSRLLERWRERSFLTLVVGEFKRGKSTFLNALVGEELLPMGVQPVTTAATRVRSGSARRAFVRYQDGAEREIALAEVRDFVDEARNPGNRLGVARVDIELPVDLPPGATLVDVPGLGSVHRHNTESALAALPEADAALVVASVDPPIGEAELRLLRAVREHAARLDVVLNKVDYLDGDGRAVAEDFTRRTLAHEGFADVAVWPVSARDGLRARLSHDDVGWRHSGMEALSASLARLLRGERTAVLARSLAKKAGRLVDQERALVEMRIAATERSSRELAQIVEAFRSRRATAERDSDEARLVFRRRFDAIFDGLPARAAEAWRAPRSAFESRVGAVLGQDRSRPEGATRQALRAAAREAVDGFLSGFVPAETRHLATACAELSGEVGHAAADRARTVWRLAADLVPFEPPEVEPPPAPPAPRPEGLQLGTQRLLLDDLEDAVARLLPRRLALRRLAAQAREEAEALYGQAVEQSRDTFRRAYEEHFGRVLSGYDRVARQTALAVEAVLAEAERRARAPAEGGAMGAQADRLRRVSLVELLGSLRRIGAAAAEGDVVRQERE
jgi:GTP-binding protein EngB required for normal cell division